MKFLLDANIPYSASEVFASRHEVTHVRDIGLGRAPDEDIALQAKERGAVIVTRDLDFANTIIFPPERHCGIIVIRVPFFYSAKDIKRVLGAFIISVGEQQLEQSLVIVEEGRSRFRKM
ncbi:MAG: DUF5615 family PIN-like protein [Parcubacteria group bacterium]|nr:DUF5615 family PIN-like protein [Parcubacteria group bacterium]